MFHLFETIRIQDGVPQHLQWHQARLNDSYYRYFKRFGGPVLEEVIRVPEAYSQGTVKCKFFYNRSAHTAGFSHYTPKPVRSLKLVDGDHIEYSMKYTGRSSLDQLYSQKEDCDDILVVQNGRITDTSYTNIVLFNGEMWITPIYPLLQGTCRARLIREGRIREGDIRVEDLKHYRHFRLINAMLDFDAQEDVDVNQIK
ncbi:MAG: aminotransferase class IV family protein [Bacteroidales bacterium]|nr:aminotransferase class IV family protein [Bacteroidales bacterium]MDT8432523.1 aminotransferase class IV family protein [Bacteroidales bacterium]